MSLDRAEVLDRHLYGSLNERGHGRHDRIGEKRAYFDGLTRLDLNRTCRPRFQSAVVSGNRGHREGERHESEHQALQLTHFQIPLSRVPVQVGISGLLLKFA